MAAHARDLCTIAAVKTHANITVSTWDTLLQTIVTAVSVKMDSYLRRVTTAQTDLVDTFRCNGRTTRVVLNEYPVTDIGSIVEDGATLGASDYAQIGERIIERRSSGKEASWSGGLVVVTYDAGYAVAAIPQDLNLAAIKQSWFEFQQTQEGKGSPVGELGRTGPTGEATERVAPGWLPDVLETLRQYRRRV